MMFKKTVAIQQAPHPEPTLTCARPGRPVYKYSEVLAYLLIELLEHF